MFVLGCFCEYRFRRLIVCTVDLELQLLDSTIFYKFIISLALKYDSFTRTQDFLIGFYDSEPTNKKFILGGFFFHTRHARNSSTDRGGGQHGGGSVHGAHEPPAAGRRRDHPRRPAPPPLHRAQAPGSPSAPSLPFVPSFVSGLFPESISCPTRGVDCLLYPPSWHLRMLEALLAELPVRKIEGSILKKSLMYPPSYWQPFFFFERGIRDDILMLRKWNKP